MRRVREVDAGPRKGPAFCYGGRVYFRPFGAERGFAWIEVINFVSLAAILGALAMYGLGRYVRHAKTAEAVGSVAAIAQAAAADYDESDATQPAGAPESAVRAMRYFPPPSRASVPADLDSIHGKRYQSTLADWQSSPWRELHFSIPQPQYYAYSFDSTGTGPQATATATARGDLNGDGVLSTYKLTVMPDDKSNAKVSPNLEKVDPEE
jgi:type II secretory pathway pseudopilin PulG